MTRGLCRTVVQFSYTKRLQVYLRTAGLNPHIEFDAVMLEPKTCMYLVADTQ